MISATRPSGQLPPRSRLLGLLACWVASLCMPGPLHATGGWSSEGPSLSEPELAPSFEPELAPLSHGAEAPLMPRLASDLPTVFDPGGHDLFASWFPEEAAGGLPGTFGGNGPLLPGPTTDLAGGNTWLQPYAMPVFGIPGVPDEPAASGLDFGNPAPQQVQLAQGPISPELADFGRSFVNLWNDWFPQNDVLSQHVPALADGLSSTIDSVQETIANQPQETADFRARVRSSLGLDRSEGVADPIADAIEARRRAEKVNQDRTLEAIELRNRYYSQLPKLGRYRLDLQDRMLEHQRDQWRLDEDMMRKDSYLEAHRSRLSPEDFQEFRRSYELDLDEAREKIRRDQEWIKEMEAYLRHYGVR